MKKFVYIILTLVLVCSCSEYQKAVKSEDIAFKTAVAKSMYDKSKYDKAITLFEVVAPSLKGKPDAENVFYMFSQSYYKTEQYYLSAYQFESYAALYPRSSRAEEALFLSLKSYSKLSPVYSLDQVDTDKAISKSQSFLNTYPNSKYLANINTIVEELRVKQEKKAFEIAKQYDTTLDYKPAIKALENFIADYPGTPFKEEALFRKLNSAYQLAINSVPSKMLDRLNVAKAAQADLLNFNANTKYKNTANDMLVRINKDLQQFSK
jgi:outer membrane protein assembly factor BamD